MKDTFGNKTKLVGIGGVDISKGERKLVLATVWQLVKVHYLSLIGDKTEDDIVAWANSMVAKDGLQIKNLKDKANLTNSIFEIKLCGAIEPRAINPDLVTPGETDADKKLNAMYAIFSGSVPTTFNSFSKSSISLNVLPVPGGPGIIILRKRWLLHFSFSYNRFVNVLLFD